MYDIKDNRNRSKKQRRNRVEATCCSVSDISGPKNEIKEDTRISCFQLETGRGALGIPAHLRVQPTSTVTSVRNNSSIPPSPPSHSQLFFSRSVYRFASAEVRGELAPLVHSAGFEAGPTPLVYRLHGQHTVPLPCWPCCPRYYRRTHVDTFCLLMIEIEIIPARHRARTGRGIAAGQHRAASCKVGLTPLSISRPSRCLPRVSRIYTVLEFRSTLCQKIPPFNPPIILRSVFHRFEV